ncbi:mechanosensitive ion channel domain-containing protein [Sphingosinicella sp. YJ22]|uniref:mechanosensitive ion channel family protein n=1 Tax=Sphingosinicella sp. YJ22 TaxID=1104780 RepID=UPI00140BC33B|nr:mechanosensitive ion channel domain-containing protein [Sphingosinicella sp. YJ22]
MMHQIAASLGIALPERFDFASAAAALALVAAAALLGWAVGRWGGPHLAALWERRAGARAAQVGPRLCAVSRDLTIWLLLTLALSVYPWQPLALFLIGLAAAAAGALFAVNLVRALQVSRLLAWILGSFVFVAVLADAVGGLAAIAKALDGVALMIGARRLSLLDLVRIAVSLVVLYLGVRLLIRVASHSIRSVTGFDPTQQLLAQKLAAVAIVIVAFFVGLQLTGIDLTTLAVFGGAFGLAIGFGLQKTVGNLFAGIILLMDRSIKPGDVIVVGDTYGSVTKIGVRAVSVVTRDGKEHLIPNEDLMTREVENWSYSSSDVRVHIPVGIAYDCDLPLAQKLMIEAAESAERVLKAPAPRVWLRAFGESSVDHDILVWIADPEAGIGNVRSEILNRLWQLFREHKIRVPYPQQDVHVKAWPAPPAPPSVSGDVEKRA